VQLSRWAGLSLALSLGLQSSIGWAQPPRDKVTLLKEEDGSRTRVVCDVVDHTGEYIRYRIREEGPITIKPSSQVISIETSQTPNHIQGLEKFASGDTKEAIRLLEIALGQDGREWVRRDILAMLVKCALRQNNYTQAGERFLMIYGSDSTTHHFKSIPLLWTTSAPDPALKSVAIQWQDRNSAPAKLLAASALLFDPKYQSSVTLELQQLRSHADARVRSLAIAQLWRLELAGRKIDDTALDGWQHAIRSMPEDLHGGPYFLLGEGRRLRRHYDRAAVAYLWVPMVHDHDYQLSAQACLSAADSLVAIGQREEAITLYREVVLRYKQSSLAQDAAQALNDLTSPAAESETRPAETSLP
jgi:tetratricopeptide (TPR) repeat protein